MEIVYTDGSDERFAALCNELDDCLDAIVGSAKQREKYNQYNTLENIHDVVLIIDNGCAVSCGSFKKYAPGVAEIKRVFTEESHRSLGYGKKVIKELENRARLQGYSKLILETGNLLQAAQKMYATMGYCVIPNYGQYANMQESVCMEKLL